MERRILGRGHVGRWDWVVWLMLAGALLAAPTAVRAQDTQPPTTARDRAGCWLDLYGLTPAHVAAAQAVLGTSDLTLGATLRLPWQLSRPALKEPGGASVSPATLARYEVPFWRLQQAAPGAQPGTPWTVRQGIDGCLPDPLLALEVSAQPAVRGRTEMVVLETDWVTFCQVEVFGEVSPCYRGADGRHYALIGVSALLEPGAYEARLRLVAAGEETSFTLPLDVAPGAYGFQRIDPPPGLERLLDVQLRDSEERYLAPWRAMRSTERRWELPLTYPLPYPVGISADYGDRRSYGGLINGYHSGVDYRAGWGTAVIAPADGVVVMAEPLETRGLAVLIDHGWGLMTGYWHLSQVDVSVGDHVRRGDVFARVGSTGLSTGAHLHWEVWANGVSVDGKQWLEGNTLGGVGLPLLSQVPEPEAPTAP